MKKFILIIVTIVFFIYPSICFSSYLIELKNGSTFITNHYWKEGRQIKFYYRGGVVGISKNLVQEIRESDLPYKEEVVEQKASQTPEITSKEAGKKAGEETEAESKEIDIEYYRSKKRDLMEEQRAKEMMLRQARDTRDKLLQKEARNELVEVLDELNALSRELKKKNNGVLPDWWQEETLP